MRYGVTQRLQLLIRCGELNIVGFERLLRPTAFGHALVTLLKPRSVPFFIPESGHDHVGPESRAILPHSPAFIFGSPFFFGDLRQPVRLSRLDVLRLVKDGKMFAKDFFAGVALGTLSPTFQLATFPSGSSMRMA